MLIDAIERVQRRAARFATNKYRNTSSVGNMLQHLEWRSLQDRRKDSRLNMFYKIVNDKVEIQKTDRLIPQKRQTRLAPYYTCYSVNFQRNKAFVGLSDRRTIGLSDYRSDPTK
jgi:hypothetical protein